MNTANVARKRVQRLRQKAERLERTGRYEEAVDVHEELDASVAELLEFRRQERVARRRARVKRNAEVYAGGLALTNLDDVMHMYRLAIEIDALYHPDSWSKGEPRE